MEENNVINDLNKKGIGAWKKTLMIIGGIFLGIIVLVVGIIMIVSLTSKKLVCKSAEGNITIMYTDKAITGYTTRGMTYDLAQQQAYAEQIGVEEYLDEFSVWFEQNTSGSCQR